MWNWDANTITTTNFTYWKQSQFNNNFYFLSENNASTSFFTHFYSFNFIYTAYFVKNYFLFTSYMKYFYLWRVSIVTALVSTLIFYFYPHVGGRRSFWDEKYYLAIYFKRRH